MHNKKTKYNNCRDWSAYFSRPVIYDIKRSYKSNKLEQKKSLPANEKKVWQLSNLRYLSRWKKISHSCIVDV